MKKVFIVLAIVFLFGIPPGRAHAFFVVDTGPGGSDIVGESSLGLGQFLAGRFTTAEDYTINSVEGWIGKNFDYTTTLDVVLYGDGILVPDTTNELLRQTIALTGELSPRWIGATGLDYTLLKGTYWIAFEYPSFDAPAFSGAMPDQAPFPLDAYAVAPFVEDDGYHPFPPDVEKSYGFRVDAFKLSSNVVPEPATMVLLGSGLIGGAFVRRKRA